MTSNNKLSEQTLSSRCIHKGRSFDFYSDEVRLPNGKNAKRDYVKYPAAAVILPFIDQENILLIKQFRYAVDSVLLELPAGKLDSTAEDPLTAAGRELIEETGYTAKDISYLFSYYPAVGYSSEIIHAYEAHDLTQIGQDLDEDEFIEPIILPFQKVLEMVLASEIKDAKTQLVILHKAALLNYSDGSKEVG